MKKIDAINLLEKENEEKIYLNECKQVIKDFMQVYILNVDENGEPKVSITDMMELINRATKLIQAENEINFDTRDI